MVTFENAVINVKKAFPELKIIEGFEFRGKYVFYHSGSHIPVEVLKQSGTVVTADTDEMFDHLDELNEARKKSVKIDSNDVSERVS